MSTRSRRTFTEVVRRPQVDLALACTLIANEVEPEVEPTDILACLDALADSVRHMSGVAVPPHDTRVTHPKPSGTPTGANPRTAAEALRFALGERAGFAGTAEDFGDVGASLLPTVLRRRHGLPILLSVVWLEVARRLDVPAYAVGLPGHVVVAIGSRADNVLVDPFAAGRLITVHEAAEKVRATGTPFNRSHLAPLDPVNLLTRILTNIRVLTARTDNARARLWAVELSLLLPHHSANLRREHGEVLVRLGDFLGGATELAAFADAVDGVEPAAAAAARQASLAARARLN